LPLTLPGIQINHYELKEIRDIQLEETKDRRDFQQFRIINSAGHNYLNHWKEISSRDEFYFRLTQIL